jgi:hypothetical protein
MVKPSKQRFGPRSSSNLTTPNGKLAGEPISINIENSLFLQACKP